jgi:hypothetical protein
MSLLVRGLVVALVLVAGVLALPGGASAAETRVGYDVSHPQCGSPLPSPGPFAIVGVNGGLSTKPNPCLAAQLRWAWSSDGSVPSRPNAQLYLNTANPGQLRFLITTWPRTGSTPYGTCRGNNDMACSWQYGYERAEHSVVSFFTSAARSAAVDGLPSRYTWWLDVETENTWQIGSAVAQARNRATLEGMTAYLLSRGGRVGLYSTGHQWDVIVGTVPSTSNLVGRNSWLAGATTLEQAMANCTRAPLVPGGRVTLTQFVPDDLDLNHSCV